MACYDPYYPTCKEDCYWYGEWMDMGARIPFCKCKKELDVLCPKDCENCAEYHSKSEKTNADRLRAMSDEELAELIDGFLFEKQKLCAFEQEANAGEYLCPGYDLEKRAMRCKICWLDWLRRASDG